MAELSAEQVAALGRLASGIIPADKLDGGASAVGAGARLAEKVRSGVNAALYVRGIGTAQSLALDRYGTDVKRLDEQQVYELLEVVRGEMPAFFKQLRMDVSAIYLSDPGVWGGIGFPGASASTGGYADFDRRQTVVQVKGKIAEP
jgi:hypothetical protein